VSCSVVVVFRSSLASSTSPDSTWFQRSLASFDLLGPFYRPETGPGTRVAEQRHAGRPFEPGILEGRILSLGAADGLDFAKTTHLQTLES
jgi:hypothetical protein